MSEMPPMSSPSKRSSLAGLYAAAGSFVLWGLSPMYWKQLQGVPALEIMSHRVLWACFFVASMLFATGRLGELREALQSKRTCLLLICSGLLIGGNWLLFIWAINSGHVLQASLGYYINPLANVLLARVIFSEKLRPLQMCSFLLAGAGVLNQVVQVGELPWISLALAASFAVYGALRKLVSVESVPGLMFETAILFPLALGYLLWMEGQGNAVFLHSGFSIDLLLIGGGIVTSAPLVGFAFGARRLSLITVGILQYIAPSLAFLQGVFLYKEPFSTGYFVTFACIWGALAVYTLEGIFLYRRQTHTVAEDATT